MPVASNSSARPRPRRCSGGREGFTLVEVACAASVLAFALTSALLVMQTGFRALDLARSTTLVSQALQSEIETIRLMSWGEIEQLPTDTPTNVPLTYDRTVATPAELSLVRTVSLVPTSPGGGAMEADLRQITVVATWKSADGRSHTRSTATQYCKNGLNDYYASARLP